MQKPTQKIMEYFTPPKKQIEIKALREMTSLGGQIHIKISYKNITGQALSFREPSKTWEVKILVDNSHSKKEASFGQIFYFKNGDQEGTYLESAETITLEPGGVFNFEYDAGQRWPHLFYPGINRVSIEDQSDDEQTIRSNKIGIDVAYDKNTFSALLGILDNEETIMPSREFAKEWILKLYPGFKFNLEGAPGQPQPENKKYIADARSWWDANKEDKDVLKLMSSLNKN